jgi:peptidoglycan/xylan/chitin deacetylase (PgdA/CDA1 family)
MHSPQEQLPFKVNSFFRNHNIDLSEISEHYMLSWAQIQELNKSNLVNFGAHTVNHLALNKISKNDIRKEVLDSKLRLELKLQQSIDHFSYPFGSTEEVNEREFSIIKECGFKTATTTRWGNIFSEHKYHNECLPRIHINEKRDFRNVNFLSLSIDGVIPCMVNKFKRVVTV